MSSSEEETSLIKTPRRPRADPERAAADEGHSSSEKAKAERLKRQRELQEAFKAWLPDGYSRIFRIVCVWPSGLLDYGSATLRCKI